MTPRQAIDQAKAKLVEDRELMSILNRTGEVRIPIRDGASATPLPPDHIPSNDPAFVVTFTLEETIFGKNLMAEFEGHKEFAA